MAIERSVTQRAQHPEWVISLDAPHDAVVGNGITGVVIANELLDNLAFTPVQRSNGELHVIDVIVDGDDQLATTLGSALSPSEAALFDDSVDHGVLQSAAAAWLQRCLEDLVAGSIIVIDYARLESQAVEIRTYAEHGYAGDPLDMPGSKDITVDVDLKQLQRAVEPATSIETQAQWLESLGIGELVEEGRALWTDGAAAGSLDALRGRSRIREAEALLDADGLGAFLVARWVR